MTTNTGMYAEAASRVAIVGGGISGLSCARKLASYGIEAVVFDTGKKAAGGRCSSRYVDTIGKDTSMIFDHSAQYFSVATSTFAADVAKLSHFGAVKRWDGRIVKIVAPAISEELPTIATSNPKYVGTEGMGSFSAALAEGVTVQRPVWVSKMERCEANQNKWKLFEYDKFLGFFDSVVIAHNGKCADRLLSTADVPRIHSLLRVTFGSQLPAPNQMRKMQLCSLWVMVFAVKGQLPVNYEGAFVPGSSTLSWICNTSKKLGISPVSSGDGVECWTAISTREYGAANKVKHKSQIHATCDAYAVF
jgi:predicted NAD/FAD-dependent oxidoreductase